jgi:hypothetical protein
VVTQAGQARVAEMNRQVAANLDKIITASKTAARTGKKKPQVRPDHTSLLNSRSKP